MSNPVTPPRPARSLDRLTLASMSISSNVTVSSPTTPTAAGDDQPGSPGQSTRTPPPPSARRTTPSHRKPVPHPADHVDIEVEISNLPRHSGETTSTQSPSQVVVHGRQDSTSSSVFARPPMYILPVDPPLPPSPTSEDHGYSYPYPTHASTTSILSLTEGRSFTENMF